MEDAITRRELEQSHGRNFADAVAIMNRKSGDEARDVLKEVYENAPEMYGPIAVARYDDDKRRMIAINADLDPREQAVLPHYIEPTSRVYAESAEALPYPVSYEKIRFATPKRLLGSLAITGSSWAASYEAFHAMTHTPVTSVGLAAFTSLVTYGIQRPMRRSRRTSQLKELVERASEHAKDPDAGAVVMEDDIVGLPGRDDRISDPAKKRIWKRFKKARPLDPDYLVDLDRGEKQGSIFQDSFSSNRDNVFISEIFRSLLRRDQDVLELWQGGLSDIAEQTAAKQARRHEIVQEVEQMEQRAEFTGVTLDAQHRTVLEYEKAILQADINSLMHGALRLGQDRFYQRRTSQTIDGQRNLLEETIKTSDKELAHPLADTLSIFKDIVYEATLSADISEASTPEHIQAIGAYLDAIPTHLKKPEHVQEIYLGLVRKFGNNIDLPAWDEVKDRFALALDN